MQVHEAVKVIEPRLEAGERITLLVENHHQPGLIRYLLPPSNEMPGSLRIALAAETLESSLRRFEMDSEVVSIAKCGES